VQVGTVSAGGLNLASISLIMLGIKRQVRLLLISNRKSIWFSFAERAYDRGIHVGQGVPLIRLLI
jgi:hypothetical protein